jgi:transcriptional regulator with XRE-family HTH domain
MDVEDVEVLRQFMERLGISKRRAAKVLCCSQPQVVMMASGKRKVGWQRRQRIRAAEAAFAAGGMEEVDRLPPFRTVRVLRSIPLEDREEMHGWRLEMGLSRVAAGARIGLSHHTIRQIEQGNARITERVRRYMEMESKVGWRRPG